MIDELPSGALRVRVYAGTDPVSKRRLDLTEVIPPGPKQARLAEEARTRLLNQVDERRNPKTRATVDQLITKYFQVLDVDTQTMRGYKSKYENHIKPLIGSEPLTRLKAAERCRRSSPLTQVAVAIIEAALVRLFMQLWKSFGNGGTAVAHA